MQFNFQSLGKAFAGMLKNRKGINLQPRTIEPSSPAQPAPPQNVAPVAPAIQNSELERLNAEYRQANETLMEAPPLRQPAEIDPVEQALATFAGTGFRSPGISARVSGIPRSLADQRGEFEYAGQVAGYQSRQNAAEIQSRTSSQLINAYLDRDAITAKIEADAKNTALKEASKQAVAMARVNSQVGLKILELDGKGMLNVPALSSVLMMNGMASPEQAPAMAEAMITDLQANPNAWMGIQQAKAQLDEQKFQQGQIEEDEKTVDSLDAPYSRRLAAIGRLQQAGRLPANADPVALANEMSVKAQEADQRMSLGAARERYLDEQIKFLPATVAMRVATALAQIQHLRNADRLAVEKFDFEQRESITKARVDAYKTALTGYQSEFGNLTNEINSLRVSRREWEKRMADAEPGSEDYQEAANEVKAYGEAIADRLAKRKQIHEKANELRSSMTEDGIDPTEISPPQEEQTINVPMPGGGGNKPVNPLSGPIGGKAPASKPKPKPKPSNGRPAGWGG